MGDLALLYINGLFGGQGYFMQDIFGWSQVKLVLTHHIMVQKEDFCAGSPKLRGTPIFHLWTIWYRGGSLGGNGIDVTQLDLMASQVINVFQRSDEIILGELNLKWHVVADSGRWVSWLFPDCSAGTN
jgi:hypothetical protein